MPKLFIANATQQVQQFTYWLPEMPRHFMHEVPIGSQIEVRQGKELTRPEIDYILKQHTQYGLRSATEALRDPNFSGVCYSIDKPVGLQMLYQLVDRRTQVLADQGRRSREAAAIATDQAINDTMQQNRMPLRLQELDMSIEEMTRDHRDPSPEVSEGVRVSRKAEPETPSPARRGQARAAGRRQSGRQRAFVA